MLRTSDMHRIDTPNRVLDKFGPGKDGFGDGVPATGTSSTKLNAAAFDNYQEEIANAIELSGMTLNPGDMTQLWQAIRNGGGLGPFVRIAGDTMTGPLDNLSGRIISTSPAGPSFTLHVPGELAVGMWPDTINSSLIFGQLDGAGLPTNGWASLSSSMFTVGNINATGLVAAASIFSEGVITTNNDIGAAGNISGTNVTANTTLFAYNGLYPAFATTQDFFLNADGIYNNLNFASAGGYYWRYERGTGLLEWVANFAVRFNIDNTGNTNATGAFTAATVTADAVTAGGRVLGIQDVFSGGPIYAAASVFPSFSVATDFIIAASGNSRGIQFSGGPYAFNFNADPAGPGAPGNNWQFLANGVSIATLDQGGTLTLAGNIFAANFPSDERIKRNIRPYTRGLSDIILLEPTSYEHNGQGYTKDTGQTLYGVIAQQAQPFVPECVQVMSPLLDQDGVDQRLPGQLGFDHIPLIYAYLNCFKEIAARLAAVESAIAAKGATS